jgi:hypothetical protein
MTMPRLEAMIMTRAVLALSVALSGAAPVHAGIPAPRALRDGVSPAGLMLEIQSVDPGDNGDGDTGGGKGRDKGGHQPGRDGFERSDRREIQITRLDTDRIVRDLRSIRLECGQYDQVYRIDCLRQGIDMVAANIPDAPEYREAKRILRRTSRWSG